MKSSTGKSKLHGLGKSRTKPHTNWATEIDYLDKLGQADKEWLARFNLEYHLSAPTAEIHSPAQLKERWKAYQANRRDISSRGAGIRGGRGESARMPSSDAQDVVAELLDAKAEMEDLEAKEREVSRRRAAPRSLKRGKR